MTFSHCLVVVVLSKAVIIIRDEEYTKSEDTIPIYGLKLTTEEHKLSFAEDC